MQHLRKLGLSICHLLSTLKTAQNLATASEVLILPLVTILIYNTHFQVIFPNAEQLGMSLVCKGLTNHPSEQSFP